MPRYFFHIIDGTTDSDHIGTDFPDLYAAQDQAVRAAGEAIRDLGGQLFDHESWKMQVDDDAGKMLFTLTVSVDEALGEAKATRPAS